MGDAQVRSCRDDDVAFFKVRIGRWRCIKAEGLLVSGDRRGHALAGVRVAMDEAHPEFKEAV